MTKRIRRSVYAGSFYPKNKNELLTMVTAFLSSASPKKINGKLRALIVPHAGYVYSGSCAGFAYKVLQGQKPSRIVLFGPTHHDYFQGAFGFEGEWVSPLGGISLADPVLPVLSNDREHSLEVQLPFLQTALGNFCFVPIIYGEISPDNLFKILRRFADDDTVFVASSDLSHYLPFEIAKDADAKTIDAILSLDLKKFLKVGDACGKTGIGALITLAIENNWKAFLLDYRTSKDFSGDASSVVGYAAICFFG